VSRPPEMASGDGCSSPERPWALAAAWETQGTPKDRGLKHRAQTATRRVPVAPPLAETLNRHIKRCDISPDDRLFLSSRGQPIATSTVLLKVYALCIGGQAEAARRHISRHSTHGQIRKQNSPERSLWVLNPSSPRGRHGVESFARNWRRADGKEGMANIGCLAASGNAWGRGASYSGVDQECS
jgi:hypothetical protein